MEAWRIDRIDFVKDTICKFCSRRLKSNVAYILVDAVGVEVQAGPKCSKNHASNPEDKVPDFTKASFDVPSEEEDEGSQGKGADRRPSASRPTGPRKEGDEAIEYLRLRMEKLTGFKGASTDNLAEVYARFCSDAMTENDRAFLKNLIAKMERGHTKYSHSNLQTCYAYSFWLDCFLEKENSDFIQSVNSTLKAELKISEGQLVGVNKWLKHQKGVPQFRPDAFKGVK
jgi:hypothetical protein